MWLPAASYGLCKLLRRSSAVVRRDGMWVSCGTNTGQGAYCAIAGLDYEPELRWLVSRLEPGDWFVDVGANIGIYSIHAARKVGTNGRVFSIEPSPEAAAILRKNVAANDLCEIVTVINSAAADKTGRLYLSGNPHQWNSLQLSATPPGIEIPVTTVDDLLAIHGNSKTCIRGIKIDAEGVEMEILQGAIDTLEKFSPIIVFENIFECTLNHAPEWLHRRGYKVYHLRDGCSLQALDDKQVSKAANLIALPATLVSHQKTHA